MLHLDAAARSSPSLVRTLRRIRAGAVAGASAGLAFAILHQMFVAVAPVVFLSVLPGAVLGLAFTPALLLARGWAGFSPVSGGLLAGAILWLALVPFFAVVLWAMDGRVWADGPLPAARPFLTLVPLLGGAIAGAVLTRSAAGAAATALAVWFLSFAVGAFLLVETRPAVFAAMAILLPTFWTGAMVLLRQTVRGRTGRPERA